MQVRDDNKKLHPCLVDFQGLPDPEKNYNLAMSGETLKSVLQGCLSGSFCSKGFDVCVYLLPVCA